MAGSPRLSPRLNAQLSTTTYSRFSAASFSTQPSGPRLGAGRRSAIECSATMKIRVVVMAVSGLLAAPFAASSAQSSPPEGTFSIVARDPKTGDLGMAVQSKALATGSRTVTIKGGVAVVAHQSQSNPMYGTLGMELLAAGMSPQQALDLMLRSDDQRDTRQVAILDPAGRSAAWTGPGCPGLEGPSMRHRLLHAGQHPDGPRSGPGDRGRVRIIDRTAGGAHADRSRRRTTRWG